MTHSYLQNYEVLSCNNLDALRQMLDTLTSPYDIWIPKRGYEIDAHVRTAPLGDLNLHFVQYGNDVPINLKAEENSGDYLLMCFLTSGAGRVTQGNETVELSVTQGLIRDARRPLLSEQVDFSSLFLMVPLARLKSHLRVLLGEQADSIDPAFKPSIDMTSIAGRHFRNSLLFAVQELDGLFNSMDGNILARNLETLLLNQIVHSLPNAHTDALQFGSIQAAVPYHVKRAREYMHAHVDQPIQLEDLSRYAGCSIRTLQTAFRNSLGSSPMGYLKSVRLERIRQELLNAPPNESVAKLALKWGFAHNGNFAKAYKAKFGVLPSETLRIKM
ncbi:MAG: hypothetical protein COV67_06135 [Nitrospinae bacterium CG11_big_fil_rev_8_21_14_0_20_56_8]|nr:MAG: hypothetical protein COV67_06135 [Nitrospinae bacterium CG11_big_fil_rev_8_21_14_0_20_56_8]